MTEYEFYQDAVTHQIAKLDAIGEKLEMAYRQLDRLDAEGRRVDQVDRLVRVLEEQEERASEGLEFLVAKRNEYTNTNHTPHQGGHHE